MALAFAKRKGMGRQARNFGFWLFPHTYTPHCTGRECPACLCRHYKMVVGMGADCCRFGLGLHLPQGGGRQEWVGWEWWVERDRNRTSLFLPAVLESHPSFWHAPPHLPQSPTPTLYSLGQGCLATTCLPAFLWEAPSGDGTFIILSLLPTMPKRLPAFLL